MAATGTWSPAETHLGMWPSSGEAGGGGGGGGGEGLTRCFSRELSALPALIGPRANSSHVSLSVGPLNEPAELQGGRDDYSTEATNTRRPNDVRASSLEVVHPLTHTCAHIPPWDTRPETHRRHTAGFTDKDRDRGTSVPRAGAYFTSLHHLHHLSAPAALAAPKRDLMEPLSFISSLKAHRWRRFGQGNISGAV
ncbi:hypothetical protein EYF80_016375 [Liparis tanakae]|uniref:Uncharacterized protein n=1 Tax=Liparis tanakae TaxID=230148 RepID=A0A4Z2I6P7_9TELE|nr:hypothetical protein EYF80_016375 [Liparis tanakae]